jgi:hypothetical protein
MEISDYAPHVVKRLVEVLTYTSVASLITIKKAFILYERIQISCL